MKKIWFGVFLCGGLLFGTAFAEGGAASAEVAAAPAAVVAPATAAPTAGADGVAGAEPVPAVEGAADVFADLSAEGGAGGLYKGTVGKIDRNLERFGHAFFQRPDSFLPDPAALVSDDYVLGPGDQLKIDVWGSIEGNHLVTLDRSGELVLPKVGVINLWGQTLAQARATIQRQIAKIFKNFEFNVTMGSMRSIQVYLVGEAQRPGTYTLSALSTVLTALSSAGGPTARGSLRDVRLLRQGKTVAEIDFYDFFRSGDKGRDVRLQAGDTIFVPIVGPTVGVAGNVRRPALYELKGGETLAQVLDLAGGIVPSAYLQKVQIERLEAHKQRTVLDVDLQASAQGESPAWQTPVQDRDLVSVLSIVSSGKFVTLSGYVPYPGKYQKHEGMRLADLIAPYGNLLPEYYPALARIVRLSPPEYRPELLTVNLEKALQGDPAHNLLLQEYDEVTLYARSEMEEAEQFSVNGAVLRPGKYRLFPGMTVKDAVAAAGNLKRSAYLAEAEIIRFHPVGRETRSERLLFNLDLALAADPVHNLSLQVDDQIFVRSIPDYAERLSVTVKGEVLFPGTYAIAKGEHLSSVLARAGGYTAKAYLRGAFFTRESLKEVQRANLEKLIFEQEQEIQRVAVQMASTAMSEEEVKSAQTLLASRKAMVEKLRQAPVAGRMVVRFNPLDRLKGSADDVELLNGDAVTVPENPQSVTVLGQVYNPTSLIYYPGRTVSYYLDKVGGPKQEADEDAIFIVRADGTVVSKQQSGLGIGWDRDNFRWVFGGFNTTVLYPGDTVLVPEQIEKTAVMRNVKDISTIFYQLALGAAAIASF